MSPSEFADFINHPSRWPYRPMLPRKLFLDEGVLTGYMMEQQGLSVFAYDTNTPIECFDSLEELIDAGWQID